MPPETSWTGWHPPLDRKPRGHLMALLGAERGALAGMSRGTLRALAAGAIERITWAAIAPTRDGGISKV